MSKGKTQVAKKAAVKKAAGDTVKIKGEHTFSGNDGGMQAWEKDESITSKKKLKDPGDGTQAWERDPDHGSVECAENEEE